MRYTTKFLVAASLVTALSLSTISPVAAQPNNEHESKRPENANAKIELAQQRAEQAKQRVASKVAELKLRRESTSSAAKSHLVAAKLKACQNRQKNVARHMQNATTFATRVMTTFDAIADKAEAFKDAKGVQVENYDALTADVEAKKTAVATAIDAAKSKAEEFSCDAEGPKT
jgi:hypothetical protein